MAASAAGREAMPGTGPGDWERDFRHLLKHSLRILELGGDEPDDDPDDEDEPVDEDDPVDEDYPVNGDDLDSQRIPITEALGDAEGVSAGRTLVDVARRPSSHGRGPPRRKKKPIGASTSLEESKHLEKLLSGVDSQRDAASTSTHSDIIWKSMRRVFCWGTPCLIKLMAIVAGVALCLMMCCAGIWYCWKRKSCSCASSEDDPKNRDNDNLTIYPSYPLLPPSALPWLHHHNEGIPKSTPPQRDPLPPSPLVLFPGQD
ncbi:uncharacterized protein LOC135308338 [Passer domesticus]|uniref:uncharacterized protein LOC135308338 n=1 Tax=Passer domesticus TaxID=48849 RepID=UPI0030FE473F